MELEIGYTSQTLDATEEEIQTALLNLPDSGDNYVILGDGDQYYIQVAGCERDGYQLEYRNGSQAEHYEADQELSTEEVVAAFNSFLKRDGSFEGKYRWRKWSGLTSRSGCLGAAAIIAFVLLILGWAAQQTAVF